MFRARGLGLRVSGLGVWGLSLGHLKIQGLVGHRGVFNIGIWELCRV